MAGSDALAWVRRRRETTAVPSEEYFLMLDVIEAAERRRLAILDLDSSIEQDLAACDAEDAALAALWAHVLPEAP